MSVKAMFKVEAIESTLEWRKKDASKDWDPDNQESVEMKTIKMYAVYGNSDPNHENTKFWNASPSGNLVLSVINPEASQHFELGKEYYLTFEKAD
jgi:hypothetical protein